jgi:hypothetical protein
MRKSISKLLIIVLFFSGFSILGSSTVNAGPFDCLKAKKYANYSKLKTAFFKAPERKTDEDWFRAYTFATIFNGYPKCFNKSDVTTMRKFIKVIDDVCSKNRNWGTICKLAPVRGSMTDWAYNSYK